MRFGTRVYVMRGSDHLAKNLRRVTGTLVGAKDKQRLIILDLHPDPRAFRGGAMDSNPMWFGASVVTKQETE